MEVNFLEACHFYVRLGWPVFPLSPGRKEPLIPKRFGGNGVKDATLDMRLISEWATACPNANVGVAMGAVGNVMVLDIDVKNNAGGMQSIRDLERQGKRFPPTVMARTPSGGWHAFFRYVDGVKNLNGKFGKGLDIKTEGGYIVGSPSYLSEWGKPYRWVNMPLGTVMPVFPSWAVQQMKPPKRPAFHREVGPGDGGFEPVAKKVESASDGERNRLLYWGACRAALAVKDGSISQGSVVARLRLAGKRIGLIENEIDKTINSGFNMIYGEGK